ncbi:MAG: hypothetical protein CMB80_22535 [Flammeovirgaceae bacterium]|nr:hypothetical protein [Flammeovirgaceae bacterium]MBE61419.1 hypothetical protein [Flammeovirgaceae bacterium]
MISYMNKWVVGALGLLNTFIVLAQKPEEDFAKYTSKFPGSNAVMTMDSEVIQLELIGDSMVTTSKVREEYYYMADNPSGYSKDRVYNSSFMKATDLEAFSLIPAKKKYSKIEVEDFKESYEMESFVFYDDGKEITFSYPSLVTGSKSVLTYNRQYKDPRMIGMFFFQSYMPVEKAEYTIIYDSRIDITVEIFNDPENRIKIERSTTDNGKSILRCIGKDLPKVKFDANSPSFQSLVPTAHFRINSYKRGDEIVPVLRSVADLHSWYQTFTHQVGTPDQAIVDMVKEVIEESDLEYERMRKIYYWVQENVRYIAFEDGMRGFIPHAGSYVLEKRYGDCKDMSSIIVDMLRAAGLEAYHTWIGTRDIPYTYEESPTPIVDNHMIATCFVDGKEYFLDATGSYTPLGLPTSMIQGKQALVDMGDTYQLLEVPVIPATENIMSDSVFFTIEEGAVNGSGEVELTGYARVFNSYRLIKTNKKSVDDYVNRLLGKGSNKFTTTDYKLSGVNDLDSNIYINYSFHIQDYYRQVGDKIYFNLVLDQTLMNGLIENREVPLENEYLYTNENVAVLDIPDGFEIEYLPENVSESSDFFSYSIAYEKQDGFVKATKTFTMNYMELEVDQFDEWNRIIKKYTRACKNALVLKKQD